MLDFHNILWVIPGVIFIYFYNKFRPTEATATAINLSGWPYLFLLAFIAALTWFPAELIVEWFYNGKVDPILHSETSINLVKESLGNKISTKKGITLVISIILVSILLWITQWPIIARQIFSPVQDNFYKKCIEWENKEILLTLKSGKTYQGLLWKYPDSPKSRHESQTISMVPFKSGYRNNETKEVIWNTYYPKYENYYDLVDMEIIIPRTEIITFGKFSSKTFEHFEKQKPQFI